MKSLDVSFAGINFTIISDNQAVLDLIEQYGFQFGPIHVRQNDTKTWKTSVETQGKLSEIIKEIEKENPVPEYTILSFKDKEMNLLITLDEKIGKYIPPSPWVCAISEARDFLASSNYPVHSVRRNSDNTTWSIGDEVQIPKSSCHEGEPTTIDRFSIADDKNTLLVRTKTKKEYSFSYGKNFIENHIHLSDLKKPVERKPIFVTEDGVNIFDTTTLVYHVSPYCGNSHYLFCDKVAHCISTGKKAFYKKEAAEEYIWKNKPVLSYNDVIRFVPSKYYDTILGFVKAK